MIRAILWAQLLSMRARRRGARAGTAFSLVTGLLFYGVFVFLGWVMMLLFSDPDESGRFLSLLSGLFLGLMLYWQLVPVITASFGASIDLQKLLAYPIPRGKLFQVEILLRAVTSFDMLAVVTGIAVGLLRNPLYGMRAAPLVIAGAVAFVAMNILLSAGMRRWLERVIMRSRFKEIFFILLALTWLAPRFFLRGNGRRPGVLLHYVPSHVIWPWAAAAHLMLRDGAAASALTAGAWICLALIFSRRQFERTLRFDAASTTRREPAGVAGKTRDSLTERIFRLPSQCLGDPLAALMEKELRTLFRIARFRMAYAMSCFFGAILFAPALRRQSANSPFLQYALPIMAVYGLLVLGQITYWNSFGFDRSAAQGYFCWPIRFRDALIAKNLTVMALLLPQMAVVALMARLFHIPSSPGKILEAFVVMTIAALFWFGLGNISSVRMPRAMNPDKMNQMSNKLQALTILAAPVVLLPVVLAYWARAVFENEFVFAGILAISAILGMIFYGVGLDSAVKSALDNRESMLLELSRADGPVSVT